MINFLFAFIAGIFVSTVAFASGAAPNSITYEGVLTDSNGAPVNLANETVKFSIVAGTCTLYSETATFTDPTGSISHAVGTGSSPTSTFDASLFGGNRTLGGCSATSTTPRSLKIEVASLGVSATVPLTSVPYALQAHELDGWGLGNLLKASTPGDATDPTHFSLPELQRVKGIGALSCASNEILKWDGTASAWKCAVESAGGGITSLNGSNTSTQTFANGTSGTAPAWSTATGVHTLNIPMAATSGVTAGLISKADYENFNSKLGIATSFSGDVSGAYNSTSVDKIKNKAVVPGAYSAGQTLRYDGTQWVNAKLDFADLGSKPTTLAGYGITDASSNTLADSKILVGNSSNVATAVSLSGDATLSNSGALTLNTVSVLKGGTGATSFNANQLVAANGTGNALQSFSCSAGQVINFTAAGVAGCENVNGAGQVTRLDSSANLPLSSSLVFAGTNAPAVSAAGKGQIYFDSTANKFKVSQNGGAYTDLVNTSTGGIGTLNGSSQATQSFATPGTSGAAPNWSTNGGTGVHTLNIPMASTASVSAGLISKTDYDAFAAKLGTTSSFSGDVSGTYNGTSVDAIKGKPVAPGAYASGQTLRFNGSQWVNTTLGFSDLSSKPTTIAGYGITDAASNTLFDSKILVGNASNVATAVYLSGDATLSNTGALTLSTVPVSKGGTGWTGPLTNGKVMISSGGAIIEGSASSAVKSNNTFVMRDGTGGITGALGTFDQFALNGATTGTINIYAPTSFTSWNLTLPSSKGTNGQVLSTDGNGVTFWTTPSGGGVLGSGTTGKIAKFTATGTMGDSILTETTGGLIGIGTASPGAGLDIATTGTTGSAIIVPRDTTFNRPTSPVNGMIRYNTSTSKLEAYQAGSWVDMIGTGAGGSYLSTTGGTLTGALTVSSGGVSIVGGFNNNSGNITNAGAISGVTSVTGSSGLNLATLTGTQFSVLSGPSSTVNYVTVKGAAAGGSPIVGTAGTDTNINLTFAPKGTGNTIFSSGDAIFSSGKVGIGTSLPSSTLDIVSTLATGIRGISSSQYSNDINGAEFNMKKARGTPISPTAIQSGDVLSLSTASGYDGSGWVTPGSFGFISSGLVGNGSIPSDFFIATGSANGGGTERLRIDSFGNVGIGTTAPTTVLDVRSTSSSGAVSIRNTNAANLTAALDVRSASSVGVVNVRNTNSVGYAAIDFIGDLNTTKVGGIGWGNSGTGVLANGLYLNTNSAAPIRLLTDGNERITVTGTGNVGIGNTTPAASLDVKGHIANSQTGVLGATLGGSATGCTASGNDTRGTVTVAGSSGSCSVTFITSYGSIPYCVASASTAAPGVTHSLVATANGFTLYFDSTSGGGASFTYICMQ